jgi:hypothetical protein
MTVIFGKRKKPFKSFCGLMAVLFICVSILSSCMSTPEIDNQKQLGEGKYLIELDSDYDEDERERTYAIEQFVISVGGTSYSLEEDGTSFKIMGIGRNPHYIVTIPGDIDVKNVPLKKHYHAGRTTGLILGTVGGGGLILLLLLL